MARQTSSEWEAEMADEGKLARLEAEIERLTREQDALRTCIDNQSEHPCTVKQPDGTVVVINPGEKKFADVPAIPVTGAVEQSAPEQRSLTSEEERLVMDAIRASSKPVPDR